jgi:hypothetical protein
MNHRPALIAQTQLAPAFTPTPTDEEVVAVRCVIRFIEIEFFPQRAR